MSDKSKENWIVGSVCACVCIAVFYWFGYWLEKDKIRMKEVAEAEKVEKAEAAAEKTAKLAALPPPVPVSAEMLKTRESLEWHWGHTATHGALFTCEVCKPLYEHYVKLTTTKESKEIDRDTEGDAP